MFYFTFEHLFQSNSNYLMTIKNIRIIIHWFLNLGFINDEYFHTFSTGKGLFAMLKYKSDDPYVDEICVPVLHISENINDLKHNHVF